LTRDFKEFCEKLPDPGLLIRYSYKQRPAARQLVIGDFGNELHVKTEAHAFLICRIVEEVDYVPSKSILYPAAFIEIEGAGRIYL
jgi:hypothetical protein